MLGCQAGELGLRDERPKIGMLVLVGIHAARSSTYHAVLVDAVLDHEAPDQWRVVLCHVLAVLFLIHPLPAISTHGEAEHRLLFFVSVLHDGVCLE